MRVRARSPRVGMLLSPTNPPEKFSTIRKDLVRSICLASTCPTYRALYVPTPMHLRATPSPPAESIRRRYDAARSGLRAFGGRVNARASRGFVVSRE